MNQPVAVPQEQVMVAKIRVDVVDNNVKTDPQTLRIPRHSRCLIVWELGDPGNGWKFLGHGISFEGDMEGQFTSLFRSRQGDKVIHFDRNTIVRQYKYTVALTKAGHKDAILEDPIIENEGDG